MSNIFSLLIGNTIFAMVLAVLAIVAMQFRRPALAHALWLLVLLKLITPPLWNVEVAWLQPASPVTTRVVETPVAPKELPARNAASDDAMFHVEHSSNIEPISAPVNTTKLPAIQNPPAPPSDWQFPDLSTMAVALWCIGSATLLLLAFLRARRFQQLMNFAQRAPHDVQQRVEVLADRIGLSRAPAAFVVESTVSPMLWAAGGSPRLVLPAPLLATLSFMQRDALVVHELAHLRRGDHLCRWFELFVTTLFFWHPLVWLARRGLRDAEEQCCDAWVIALLPDSARSYADALVNTLDFLSASPQSIPPGASGLGGLHQLQRRLTMLFTHTPPKSLSVGGWTLVIALAGCLPLMPVRGQTRDSRTYYSESKIYVEPAIGNHRVEGPGSVTRGNYLQTQVELLRSRPILNDALGDARLKNLKTFEAFSGTPIEFLEKHLAVSLGSKDDILTVEVAAPNAEDAARIVSAVVDAYVRHHQNETAAARGAGTIFSRVQILEPARVPSRPGAAGAEGASVLAMQQPPETGQRAPVAPPVADTAGAGGPSTRAVAEALTPLLNDPELNVVQSTRQALVSLGAEAVPSMVAMTAHENPEARKTSLRVLRDIVLDTDQMRSRFNSATNFVEMQTGTQVGEYGRQGRAGGGGVIMNASVQTIRSMSSPGASKIQEDIAPAAIRAISDSDSSVRLSALWLLPALMDRPQDLRAAVVQLSDDPSDNIRLETLRLTDWLMTLDRDASVDVLFPSVKKRLTDATPEIRAKAIGGLPLFGTRAREVSADVIKALKDESAIVRAAAATTIGAIQNPAPIEEQRAAGESGGGLFGGGQGGRSSGSGPSDRTFGTNGQFNGNATGGGRRGAAGRGGGRSSSPTTSTSLEEQMRIRRSLEGVPGGFPDSWPQSANDSQPQELTQLTPAQREEVARQRRENDLREQASPTTQPRLMWRGLDLSAARVTTRTQDLADIWEAVPPGSRSYEVRKDVTVIPAHEIPKSIVIYWLRSANRFYVQYDLGGSSTHHFYGPFEGDPNQVLAPPTSRPAGR